MRAMNRTRLVLSSLRYYWRSQLAVGLGMVVGSAVLCGALIVGDSVRASLREITMERLGAIDYALSSPNFFSGELASHLAAADGFEGRFKSAAPAIIQTASAEAPDAGRFSRGVNLVGADTRFWSMERESPGASDARLANPSGESPSGDEVWINQRLADDLGASRGDTIVLRFLKPDPIPAEAVHGRRTGSTLAMRARVGKILPNRGFGRFGLTPGQQLPLNAFVSLSSLQEKLGQRGHLNSILVAGKGAAGERAHEKIEALKQLLVTTASLDDLGLQLIGYEEMGTLRLESRRMVLRQTDVAAAQLAATEIGARAEPTLTYLANTMTIGDRTVPYSTVTALNASAIPPLGPLILEGGEPAPALKPGEIYLNTWTARELNAHSGDVLRMTYYLTGPEGEFEDNGESTFTVRGVVQMEGLGAQSTLTPNYPGINEAPTMRDWDPPFPIDLSLIRDRDEQYWKTYRALPKAFVSLDDATRLWTSRFGEFTSLRIAPREDMSPDAAVTAFTAALRRHIDPEFAGLLFSAVKAQGLQASGGASDFGMLFIGFSFFIIVSAMLLVGLIAVLGVEQRTREIGILIAVGYSPAQVRRLFLAEGGALALLAGIAGSFLGLGFAALMLHGLRTWWNASVGTTFLDLHARPMTLVIGGVSGAFVGAISIYLAHRRMAHADPLELIGGGAEMPQYSRSADSRKSARREEIVAGASALIAAVCLVASAKAPAGAQAALFYTAGMLLLVAALSFLSARLRNFDPGRNLAKSTIAILRVGARNAARNRRRSLLTVGLMSSAAFVVVTVGAMKQSGGDMEIRKDSGNGGFSLLAESDSPVLLNLNTTDGRFDLGLQPETDRALAKARVYGLRLNPGEDASCLNLYKPSQPRILGAPQDLVERGGFAFQGVSEDAGASGKDPWTLLNGTTPQGEIPVIGDYNTVMWILHSGLGRTLEIRDGAGRPATLKFVALMKGSALQGELIVSEQNFIDLFPERVGAQFFLIECPPSEIETLQSLLERDLRPYGFDAATTAARIESYHAVENTYLSTFQALGGFGLLLGTFGLTAVILRGILERRGELALMTCLGFGARELSLMVLAENFLLLFLGLFIGFGAALIAVAPAVMASGSGLQFAELGWTLLGLLAVGGFSGLWGVREVAKLPVLESLRAP